MTYKQHFTEYLSKKGLLEWQATKIVDIAIQKQHLFGSFEWERQVGHYPKVVEITTSIAIDTIALEWIEGNCPLVRLIRG